MIAMVVFILFMSSEVKDAVSGAVVGNVINKDWTAGKGMITAIIVGLLVGVVYSWFYVMIFVSNYRSCTRKCGQFLYCVNSCQRHCNWCNANFHSSR